MILSHKNPPPLFRLQIDWNLSFTIHLIPRTICIIDMKIAHKVILINHFVTCWGLIYRINRELDLLKLLHTSCIARPVEFVSIMVVLVVQDLTVINYEWSECPAHVCFWITRWMNVQVNSIVLNVVCGINVEVRCVLKRYDIPFSDMNIKLVWLCG